MSTARGVFFAKLSVCVLISFLFVVTVQYCATVYYDQNAALSETYSCLHNEFGRLGRVAWLDEGSLLGAVRIHAFVIWDSDIDLSMLVDGPEDADAVLKEVGSACRLKLQKQSVGDRARNKHYLYNSHVTVAVAEWQASRDASLMSTAAFQASYDTILPLHSCFIGLLNAWCPNKPQVLLQRAYGPNWGNESFMTLF